MNTRKYPRTLDEAYPFGPEYGCSIEHYKPGRIADIAVAIALVIGAVTVGLVLGGWL